MAKEAPPKNNVAHVVRNAVLVFKALAKHCEMANPICPMLKRIQEANLDLEAILRGEEITNEPGRFFS